MTTIRDTYRRTKRCGWPLERVLFALAGNVIVASVALAMLVSPWFSTLTLLVGVNQLLYAGAGMCPASLILSRVLGLRSALYCGLADDRPGQPASHTRQNGTEAAEPKAARPGPMSARNAANRSR